MFTTRPAPLYLTLGASSGWLAGSVIGCRRLSSLFVMAWPVVVVVVVVIWFFILLIKWLLDSFYYGYSVCEETKVKAPVLIPFFGHLFHILGNRNRIYDWNTETTRRFNGGSWGSRMPFRDHALVLNDPKNLEFVLKTEFYSFVKGPEFQRNLADLLGDSGIFTTNGTEWKVQRQIASRIFHVRNFREFFMQIFREEMFVMFQILDERAKSGQLIDLYDLLHRFTLDSFARIGFGSRLGVLKSLLDGDDSPVAFAAAFDKAQSLIQFRFMNPFWRVTEFLDGSGAEIKRNVAVIDKFAYEIIEQRKNDPDLAEKTDLLSRFILATSVSGKAGDDDGDGSNQHHYSDKQLRDMVMSFMIAGRDTTAQTLSWTFYELFKNPGVIDKIRGEISEKIGVLGNSSSFSVSLSYDQILKLEYAKCVFNETLRLHPAVPTQLKKAAKQTVLPDGTKVPAGTMIIYSNYAMGRLPQIWGHECEKFMPERFLASSTLSSDDSNPERKFTPPSHFKFPVFNAGPRLCLGMNMAYLEGVMVLCCLLDRYNFELAMPLSDVEYQPGLTLLMKRGLKVRVERKKMTGVV